MVKRNVIIIGGGLAGLSSAIHLAKFGIDVLLIEKDEYPQHKVCGEYVSNEVLPYLNFLGIDVFKLNAKRIDTLELSTTKGQLITTDLPLGGFGISRFCFDDAMAKQAVKNGVKILQDSVVEVTFSNNTFTIITKKGHSYYCEIAIGAYGKRSSLDVKLNREFIKKKSPFLAVKTHLQGAFPEHVVGLHNFKGGYCGVSKVENNRINVCYICNYDAFKRYHTIDEFQEKVLSENNNLKTIFSQSNSVFEQPLTISQISFDAKNPIENHVIMCGDTAGLIHPLCGNGMSMAIRSAQIASIQIIKYFNSENFSREALEKQYLRAWNKAFKSRLKMGHMMARLFESPRLSESLMRIIKWVPWILPQIIKRTHGKMMQVE